MLLFCPLPCDRVRQQNAHSEALAQQVAAVDQAREDLSAANKLRHEAELRVQVLQREVDTMSRRLLELAGTGPGPTHPATGGSVQGSTCLQTPCMPLGVLV